VTVSKEQPTFQPVSRAKDAVVEVNVPGPDGSRTLTITGDGYQAADDVEAAALEANPLVQHKLKKTED
jgi:hypothetical protein